MKQFVKRNGHSRVPLRHTVDDYRLGAWVRNQRDKRAKGTLQAERESRLESLPGWTWDTLADLWEEGFSQLQEYIKREGHARVPQRHSVEGYNLGAWVNTQRKTHATGILEADRESRLEALPGWIWDPLANQWEEGFSQLQQFIKHHGHSRVPHAHTVDGFPLGHWVQNQRISYAKGVLEADRLDRLESLPGWAWDASADRWEEGFRRLRDYTEREGHARVPSTYRIDGFGLGAWVNRQRDSHAKGVLEADPLNRLESLPGWSWNPQGDLWEDGYSQLRDFVEHHGHARVPRFSTVDGFKLGAWVSTQRWKHGNGILEADRESRLEALPGWTWDAFADRWEEGFGQLQQYVERHGDASVPRSYTVDGYRLGLWVKTQRRSHSAGTLDADRESRLEALPGWRWKASSSR